ncbi:TPA: hypothetical protein HA239_05325 [Candidatus Woesearchaeota archaeon]|nr:hypothetical protein QT06_C0001G0275 [archaeon GW2011_AR15]MBS3103927.1 hypothetical protein [Candidatus Woesearchaeota archaeon]HIH41803.1 hypothetical protein [Candidatus Woesearchaeota archaeon]
MDYTYLKHLPHYKEHSMEPGFTNFELAEVVTEEEGRWVHRWHAVVGLEETLQGYNLLYFSEVSRSTTDMFDLSGIKNPLKMPIEEIVAYHRLTAIDGDKTKIEFLTAVAKEQQGNHYQQ